MVRVVLALAILCVGVSALEASKDVEKVAVSDGFSVEDSSHSAGGAYEGEGHHPEEKYPPPPDQTTASDGFSVGAEHSEHGDVAAIDDTMVSDDVKLPPIHHEVIEGRTPIQNGHVQGPIKEKEPLSVLQFNVTSDIKPEIGDTVPPFVQSFPGCQCTWESSWSCKGTIAYPAEVAGEKCCCCGLKCNKRRRCTNDKCMAIGVDQGPEIAAEQAAWDKKMKGADVLLGDDFPAFRVSLEKGHCTDTKIKDACNKKGLHPVCDHPSYGRTNQCWTPAGKDKRFNGRHFSHWQSHRQYFGIEDDSIFYGMCFYTVGNGQWALAPYSNSHAWTNGNTRLTPMRGASNEGNPHFNNLNNCDLEAYGCWKTLCVAEKPAGVNR